MEIALGIWRETDGDRKKNPVLCLEEKQSWKNKLLKTEEAIAVITRLLLWWGLKLFQYRINEKENVHFENEIYVLFLSNAAGRTRTGTVLPAWFWVKCVCQFRHSGTKLTLRYLNIFFLWMQEKNRDKWEKLTYDSNSEIDYRYLACIFLSYCENIINIRRENRFSCAQKQEEIIWSRSAEAAGINRLHVRIFANKSFLRGYYLANWIRTLCNGENMYRKQWKTGKK